MSLNQVLDELPQLTVRQRQVIVRRAIELDDAALSPQDEAVVEARMAEHKRDRKSAVSLKEIEARLRSKFRK